MGRFHLAFAFAFVGSFNARDVLSQNPATPTERPLRAETVRGRVTSDSSHAIAGATVIITMAPDRTSLQTLSGVDGSFEVHFERGTGDYLVYVSVVGFRAFRRRVLVPPDTPSLTVEVRLQRDVSPQQLAAVRVQTQRPRPTPDLGAPANPANQESIAQGVTAMLSPDQMGNLLSIVATIPGLSLNPDGSITAFGTAGQVSTTLNGMATSAADIPSGARANVRITTSTWDPSVGGFGGARANVEIANATRQDDRTASLLLDAPPLQFTDPVSRRLGQRLTNIRLGTQGSGPIGSGTGFFYNGAIEARRTTNDAPSLTNATGDVLALAGVASDSVARLFKLLSGRGIPITAAGIPSQTVNESATLLGWAGYLPHVLNPRAGLPRTIPTLTTLVNVHRTDSPGGLRSTPSVGGATESWNAQAIGHAIHYVTDYLLDETMMSLSIGGLRSRPYLNVPSGSVRISSMLPNGEGAVTGLGFGGGNSGVSGSSWSWEVSNTLQFFAGRTHRIKIYGDARLEWQRQSGGLNRLGMFTYNSLEDLAAGRPTMFARTLDSPSVASTMASGVVGIGDLWKIAPTFSLEYSARVEGNQYLTRPDSNPTLLQQFGLTNSHVPNTLGVVPRIGFAWTYGVPSPSIVSVPLLGRAAAPPKGVLRGGIGEFRNALAASTLTSAMLNTGLPSATSQLLCVGPAVPTPDWSAYLSNPAVVPTQCASGSSSFASAAPAVQLFDPSFDAARSWRSLLGWSSAIGKFRYSIDLNYSVNLRQLGVVDRNFANSPRFALAAEANRPVFVTPASIVTATGALSPVEARRSASFANVSDRMADLSSDSRSATISVVPMWSTRALLTFAYTLSDATETQRGFDGSTFGSPETFSRSRARFDARHLLQVGFSYRISDTFFGSAYTVARSGLPYSPMVAGDVNGDGLANDRAFVFDPARTSDAAVAGGMRSLIASAPVGARRCLLRQLGAGAQRNSCNGPWTGSVNAMLGTKFFRALDGRLVQGALHFTNLLGGIDQLLHGADQLRGWGVPASPDPVLFFVRGFDPATKSFKYEVNTRFGSTRPSQTPSRAPFRVTIAFTIEIGVPIDRQTIRKLLDAGRRGHSGMAMPADSIRRIYSESVLDIYQSVILQRDSLLLTVPQVAALQADERAYRARADSLWREFATWAAQAPDAYSARDVQRHLYETYDAAFAIARAEIPRIRAILTPLQLSLAYGPAGEFLGGRTKTPGRFTVIR